MSEVKFVEQAFKIEHVGPTFTPISSIANAARTCYRSEREFAPGEKVNADMRLVESLVRRDHGAMLEHSYLSVRFKTDRAVANEIVRHRHFSFAQESTRYVNYDNRGFEFILPVGINGTRDTMVRGACRRAARSYELMLANGATPQEARAVLPLCTATEIVVTGNFREWRHFLRLRTAPDAHPQMRALVTPLLEKLKKQVFVVFDDIRPEEGQDGTPQE